MDTRERCLGLPQNHRLAAKTGSTMDEEMKKKGRQRIPWWLYLLFAVISYALLRYGPVLLGISPTEQAELSILARRAAPIAAIVFLLLAANSLYADEPPKDSGPSEDHQPEDR